MGKFAENFNKYRSIELKKSSSDFIIKKTDEDKQLVFGWAQVAATADGQVIEDWQHDIVTPEDLETAAYAYVLNFRDTGEQHNPDLRQKGKLVESVVFTKEKMAAMGIPEGTLPYGWWVGYHIDDPEAWDAIKSGEYQMFSVEGTGMREPIPETDLSDNRFIAKSFLQVFNKYRRKALTFYDNVLKYNLSSEEVTKFNSHHDSKGRFSSSSGSTGISATGANKFKKGFSSTNLDKHWGGKSDHSSQYPQFTKDEYAKEALKLIQKPVSKDIKGYKNSKDQIVRYRISTNDFVKGHPKVGIATMFKPNAKMTYYLRKKKQEAAK
jgi:hypothetical protein